MANIFMNERIIEDKEYPYGKFIFYKDDDFDDRKKSLFLGFENEVGVWDDGDESRIDLETICNCFLRDLIIYKSEYGCNEIISHPFTLNYLRNNEVVFKFLFDFLRSNKKYYRIQKSSLIGMHIHVNSSFFNNKEKIKIAKFIYDPINLQFLTHIAETNQDRINIYARFDKEECPTNENSSHYKLYSSSDFKCCAVHFRQEIKTIEFRFFHATNSYSTFLKNIEFIHCLSHFCKAESFDNMKHTIFCKFLRKNKKKYPNIFKFLFPSSVIGKCA